jgi:hypothetical protein
MPCDSLRLRFFVDVHALLYFFGLFGLLFFFCFFSPNKGEQIFRERSLRRSLCALYALSFKIKDQVGNRA